MSGFRVRATNSMIMLILLHADMNIVSYMAGKFSDLHLTLWQLYIWVQVLRFVDCAVQCHSEFMDHEAISMAPERYFINDFIIVEGKDAEASNCK